MEKLNKCMEIKCTQLNSHWVKKSKGKLENISKEMKQKHNAAKTYGIQ